MVFFTLPVRYLIGGVVFLCFHILILLDLFPSNLRMIFFFYSSSDKSATIFCIHFFLRQIHEIFTFFYFPRVRSFMNPLIFFIIKNNRDFNWIRGFMLPNPIVMEYHPFLPSKTNDSLSSNYSGEVHCICHR